MNTKEFTTLAAAIKTFYPRERILPNEQAMELWYGQLKDIPYEVAVTALNKWVSTNKWSPSIADIRELATSIQHGDIPDWGESWEKVCAACRKFGRDRSREALESFDDLTRESVKRIGGFTYICNSENTVADRARFEQVYNALAERKKKEDQLSVPLQQMIQGFREENKLLEERTQ